MCAACWRLPANDQRAGACQRYRERAIAGAMDADPDITGGAIAGGLARLFEQHRPELLRFLRARCGDAAEADDLAQELWLKIAAAAPGPIANGRSYLFR